MSSSEKCYKHPGCHVSYEADIGVCPICANPGQGFNPYQVGAIANAAHKIGVAFVSASLAGPVQFQLGMPAEMQNVRDQTMSLINEAMQELVAKLKGEKYEPSSIIRPSNVAPAPLRAL